jgi:hypothetical protein
LGAESKKGGPRDGTERRMYLKDLKARELGKHLRRGLTMTEYALILEAIAIVVFLTYEVMCN